jgi:uncharacterized membrane protein YhiD involved in acid resistance
VVIGIGYPLTGLVLTFCVWFVLEPWRWFERWVQQHRKARRQQRSGRPLNNQAEQPN